MEFRVYTLLQDLFQPHFKKLEATLEEFAAKEVSLSPEFRDEFVATAKVRCAACQELFRSAVDSLASVGSSDEQDALREIRATFMRSTVSFAECFTSFVSSVGDFECPFTKLSPDDHHQLKSKLDSVNTAFHALLEYTMKLQHPEDSHQHDRSGGYND